MTLIRLEGIGASVVDRAKSVSGILTSFGTVDMIEDDTSRATVGVGSRCHAVRGIRAARRVAGVADRVSAGIRRRLRPGAGPRYRRRVSTTGAAD